MWYDKRPDENEAQRAIRVATDFRASRSLCDRVIDLARAEVDWLEASMRRDMLPQWLIELVITKWAK